MSFLSSILGGGGSERPPRPEAIGKLSDLAAEVLSGVVLTADSSGVRAEQVVAATVGIAEAASPVVMATVGERAVGSAYEGPQNPAGSDATTRVDQAYEFIGYPSQLPLEPAQGVSQPLAAQPDLSPAGIEQPVANLDIDAIRERVAAEASRGNPSSQGDFDVPQAA